MYKYYDVTSAQFFNLQILSRSYTRAHVAGKQNYESWPQGMLQRVPTHCDCVRPLSLFVLFPFSLNCPWLQSLPVQHRLPIIPGPGRQVPDPNGDKEALLLLL